MGALDDFLAAMQAETNAERAEQLRRMMVAGNRIIFAVDVWASLAKHFGFPPETERFEAFGMEFEVGRYVPAGMMVSMPNISPLLWLVPMTYVDQHGEPMPMGPGEYEERQQEMMRGLGIPRHIFEGRT